MVRLEASSRGAASSAASRRMSSIGTQWFETAQARILSMKTKQIRAFICRSSNKLLLLSAVHLVAIAPPRSRVDEHRLTDSIAHDPGDLLAVRAALRLAHDVADDHAHRQQGDPHRGDLLDRDADAVARQVKALYQGTDKQEFRA